MKALCVRIFYWMLKKLSEPEVWLLQDPDTGEISDELKRAYPHLTHQE